MLAGFLPAVRERAVTSLVSQTYQLGKVKGEHALGKSGLGSNQWQSASFNSLFVAEWPCAEPQGLCCALQGPSVAALAGYSSAHQPLLGHVIASGDTKSLSWPASSDCLSVAGAVKLLWASWPLPPGIGGGILTPKWCSAYLPPMPLLCLLFFHREKMEEKSAIASSKLVDGSRASSSVNQ